MKTLLVIILIYLPCLLFSQTVSNIRHQTEKGQVMIFYDLDSEWPVNVSVHLSSDGGRSLRKESLKQVTAKAGDYFTQGVYTCFWSDSPVKITRRGIFTFTVPWKKPRRIMILNARASA